MQAASYENGGGSKQQQVKMLEEEIAYLKKNYEVEMGIMKNETEILKKQLMEVQQRRLQQHVTPNRPASSGNFCSPIRLEQ